MVREILTGWKNYLDKSEVVEQVAKERAGICSKCPKAKKGSLLVFVKDKLKNVEGHYCSVCNCPLSSLIRSNKNCELNKW